MNPYETKEPDRNAARLQRDAILADFRATFTSEHGARVLAVLKSSARFGQPCFLHSATNGGDGPFDPLRAAYINGRQSILSEIIEHLDTPEDRDGDTEPTAIRPTGPRSTS